VSKPRSFHGQADKNVLDKAVQAFAKTRLGGKMFITVIPAWDKRLRALTGGHVGLGVGQPVLTLHARGAKSGQPRKSPLLYTLHGEKILVVASKAGATSHPAWYHNVVAHPDVEVEIGGERTPMRARIAAGTEREQLWAVVNDHYNGYAVYQQRAGSREIPVVVLEPR
jgi:deazaflavin-dependent oxidoreductase (nitroreductase family)